MAGTADEMERKLKSEDKSEREEAEVWFTVKKMTDCLKYCEKLQRRIRNEPDSDAKREKLRLMRLVIARVVEPVGFWRECRKKEERSEKEPGQGGKKEIEKRSSETLPEKRKEYNENCVYFKRTIVQKEGYDDRERVSCGCGMDMTYCGPNCAFSTNHAGTTRAYDAPVTINYRRVGREHE